MFKFYAKGTLIMVVIAALVGVFTNQIAPGYVWPVSITIFILMEAAVIIFLKVIEKMADAVFICIRFLEETLC